MSFQTIRCSASNSIVKIEQGELVSFTIQDEELMHQKGTPGWRNTDTEMFPLIGPTAENNFKVATPKGTCIQDQHGLLRELEYEILNSTESTIHFSKEYKANTPIKNSKFPEKSTEELLSWPYDFTFIKKYHLNESHLHITFEIKSEVGMPFMLGYHPAFMLSGNLQETITTNNKSIAINEVLEVGDMALPVLNTTEITLNKQAGRSVKLETKGFDNYMLWAPVPTMICIEPITDYPYVEGGIASGNLFKKSVGMNSFEVIITPM